ncbi:hypothetical protein [Bacillus cihuensis]|uniref:hypothetical protein n=1 Tax=Bacillus cihuensis TaxID=1208599 RepID=UPI00041415B1|nr:hypothetical protein [Bacillus cihuensis]
MAYISRSYDDGDFRRKEREEDHCKDRDREEHKKEEKKAHCFVSTHGAAGFETLNFSLPANTTTTVFEDFTKNHNKTFITLQPNYDITVTIKTRKKHDCHKTIHETVPANGLKVFQVEDFKELVIKTGANETNIYLGIQKTFCICCKDENNEKHEKHHKHHDCDCD